MQSSQRSEYNHALEYAIHEANRLNKPMITYFGLTDQFPEANARHYHFMLEGLKEVKEACSQRNIKMMIRHISPEIGALEITNWAALLVTDRSYLRIEREWKDFVATRAKCLVVQVESNVMIPVEEASSKEEYSAATLRRKISKKLEEYSFPLEKRNILQSSLQVQLPFAEFDCSDVAQAVVGLQVDQTIKQASLIGGQNRAKQMLEDFIDNKLTHYNEGRNIPGEEYASSLSPYLHFGQISPLYIYLRLLNVHYSIKQSFLEELIVRRELSINFVYYNNRYDSYDCLPAWARNTLDKHRGDEREVEYSLAELEQAKSYDPFWNTAQKELLLTGQMQGYMRMYWGKKILEWSRTPEEAYKATLYLNNKYALDGRDPNGFAGVAWCFGKHDRAWAERAIFGTLRYMNDKGLKRKFDMKQYLLKVERLEEERGVGNV